MPPSVSGSAHRAQLQCPPKKGVRLLPPQVDPVVQVVVGEVIDPKLLPLAHGAEHLEMAHHRDGIKDQRNVGAAGAGMSRPCK